MAKARLVVIKIGSALLKESGHGLKAQVIASWAAQISHLYSLGWRVILVSSGAVSVGLERLGWSKRPDQLEKLQAAASVGQLGLMHAYEQAFLPLDLICSQVLLTHQDLADRQRYLNIRSTFCELLQAGVVPIVNENDTVATDEIRFGDNDILAALVAGLVDADSLIILTDFRGLFESDPRINPDAAFVTSILASDKRLDHMATGALSGVGTGGMAAKVRAARVAARAGISTRIAYGHESNVLIQIFESRDPPGTLFISDIEPLAAKKKWLLGQLIKPKGSLVLDAGAVEKIQSGGASLLAVGILAVEGSFDRGDPVACVDEQGRKVAVGLVHYHSKEIELIKGQPSRNILPILGFCQEESVIHADHLVSY